MKSWIAVLANKKRRLVSAKTKAEAQKKVEQRSGKRVHSIALA